MLCRIASLVLLFFYSQLTFALMFIPCSGRPTTTIVAVGDVLLHKPLQDQASVRGFLSIWQSAIPFVRSADVAFANVEGPIAEGVKLSNGKVYSSYPLFNYPPQLAYALKATGFDVVNLANNHSLDRFRLGVNKTITLLDQIGIKHVGTSLSGKKPKWFAITNVRGFKLAWIGCATHTNGVKDKYHQVLNCYQKNDRKTILKLIAGLKSKVDAIILTPHWGKQYEKKPDSNQKRFAHQMLNAGATVILGTHPHVLQPMKTFKTKDGRRTFIAYSLGNFVSYQGTPANRASVILFLQLEKVRHGTQVCSMRYLPTYMQNRQGLNKIHLKVLGSGDRGLIGYRIVSKILPANDNLAMMR